MFNLKQQTKRVQQLEIEKIQGLPYKPKPKRKRINPKILQELDILYEQQAISEGIAISKRPRYRNPDFDIRLRKRSGHNHRRRGHIQGGCYKYTGLPEK